MSPALPTAPLAGALKSKHVAWRMLLTTHALLIRATDESLRAAGMMPFDWHDVLMALHEAESGKLRPCDLADAVLLSRAGISRRIERMERAGLLIREQHPGDRRSVFLSLSDKGRMTLLGFWPHYRAAIERHFTAALTAGQAQDLSSILHGVLTRIGETRHQAIFPQGITEEP